MQLNSGSPILSVKGTKGLNCFDIRMDILKVLIRVRGRRGVLMVSALDS